MGPYLVPVGEQLEEQIKVQRARNEGLVRELLRKRAEIEEVVGGLEGVVRDLEGANGILYAASTEMEDGKMD